MDIMAVTNSGSQWPARAGTKENWGCPRGISLEKMGGEDAPYIPVVEGEITTIYVNLKPQEFWFGAGYFRWDITNNLSNDNFEIELTLTDIIDDTIDPKSIIISPTELKDSSPSMYKDQFDSCYFYVDMKLTTFDDNHDPIGTFEYRDIAHLYPGMITTFRYTLTDDLIVVPPPTGVKIIIEFENPGYYTLSFEIDPDNYTGTGKDLEGDGTQGNPFILSKGDNGTNPTGVTITTDISDDTVYFWFQGTHRFTDYDNEALVLTADDLININPSNLNTVFVVSLVVIVTDEYDNDMPITIGDHNGDLDGIYFKVVD
jgi:hypothetical protein